MLKRPNRDESEQDILEMQQKFLAEKAKNPKMQPAAKVVKVEKVPKKSLFAQNRQRQRVEKPQETIRAAAYDTKTNYILDEIHGKIVGDIGKKCSNQPQNIIPDIVIGDIVENSYTSPKELNCSAVTDQLPFPKVSQLPLKTSDVIPGKSLFAMSVLSNRNASVRNAALEHVQEATPMDCESIGDHRDLATLYGETSVIVDDEQTATEVHKANLNLMTGMPEADILAEREKLLNSIDPSLIALLAKRRKEKERVRSARSPSGASKSIDHIVSEEILATLPDNNPAIDILQKSESESWIHFDVVEKDKLEWMHDIPVQASKLKSGEKFEARFDWKGILLPYSTDEISETKAASIKDERELYLHGSEPHRPGYTLQELFRLARSNVAQQRVSAFGAIAGILNIYNQGFYDKVLELPITKMFFLIRFGLDDNTPSMLEVVSKALAVLCYNETDETLLDFIYDNPNCYWQPILNVTQSNTNDDDPTSIENLQKQMKQLQMSSNVNHAKIKANIDESEEESKMSMSDFQLAETDLIECLLRTNILQRIYFILSTVRANNSTVLSCMKILITMGRSSKETAVQIMNNDALIDCLFDNFLPGLEHVDTMQRIAPIYNYPQHLCLKLFRVLISQDLGIGVKFLKLKLIEKLQNYLFCSDNIRDKLIKVQIESLRVLRCLLLFRIDNFLYRRFLPAFRFMLEWHFNHNVYDLGSSHLIRQHAAALLSAISSFTAGSGNTLEMSTTLGEVLYNCCCNWFHQAKRHGIKEFSQATLLSTSLHTITCYIHHCGTTANTDAKRFQNFIEKYIRDFIASDIFAQFISSMPGSSSIVLRNSPDRRNVHIPLPNVGSVIMHQYGPQLIISQTYGVHLLNALWRLLEIIENTEELSFLKGCLLDVIIQPRVIEPLVEYLRRVATKMNLYLATNFFAKSELQLIFKLLSFEGISIYFTKAELMQIAYNFLCCLTAEHISEIGHILERYIFNSKYLEVDEESLNKWRTTCLELVYPHYIVLNPNEITLSICNTQIPILPRDWPYFQLKIILQNYIDNVQQKPPAHFSEREVLQMTFTFVSQLEKCNPNLQIVTPTEKLMYLMIAFMGPDSQFLDAAMRPLLEEQMRNFYTQCEKHTFQFDASYEGKCKFENLYALFVDHFQAASYGDELFSSLVMIPLAQKYDNKWRRRVWSDYASALRFLHCDERWLIGGLKAYIEPAENDKSLIHAYDMALRTNLLRINSLPYRIAKYHVEKFKEKINS